MTNKIYILEDDESIRELVCYTLNQSGYTAFGFELPSLFFKAIEKELPDLVLLDIMLPETDGLQVLKKLRQNHKYSTLPVIMLTAKTTEYDIVVGLDLGADDYVVKPFGMMELLSRIKAVLRRTPSKKVDHLCIANLEIIPKKHKVLVDGEKIKLTSKEYELLILLVENLEMVITRDQLLDRIWGYDFDGETRTVDVHVRSLRKKLGTASNIIQTERGFGYKAVDPGEINV